MLVMVRALSVAFGLTYWLGIAIGTLTCALVIALTVWQLKLVRAAGTAPPAA